MATADEKQAGSKKRKRTKDHHQSTEDEDNIVATTSIPPPTNVPVKAESEEWSKDDVKTLLARVRAVLPPHDVIKYSTQMDRTDWSKVAFGVHSAETCKSTCVDLTNKLRRFRTLTELVIDADNQIDHLLRLKGHPELPKKPLTPFFRYFNEKRKKFIKKHPGLSVTEASRQLSEKYKELNEAEKKKYTDRYTAEYEAYKLAMAKFKADHPEWMASSDSGGKSRSRSSYCPKVTTPMQIYIKAKMEEHLKKEPEVSRRQLYELYRTKWGEMSDRRKLKYIDKALEAKKKYETDLEAYLVTHPEFKPKDQKTSFLSKAERKIKDKQSGKPVKPAANGYGLFTQVIMPDVLEKKIPDRMQEISRRWKALAPEQRDIYNKEVEDKHRIYHEEIRKYLQSLPEGEERMELEQEITTGHKPKATTSVSPVCVERPQKPISALYFYMDEKRATLQKKNPVMSDQDINKLLVSEFSALPDKEKARYKNMEEAEKERIQKMQSFVTPSVKSKKIIYLPGEPRRPPMSAYQIFSTEMLSTLKDVPSKDRLTVISQKWKVLTQAEKRKYEKEKNKLAEGYRRDLTKYKESLSRDELTQFEELRAPSKKSKKKRKLDFDEPTSPKMAAVKSESSKASVSNTSEDDSSDSDDSNDDDDDDVDAKIDEKPIIGTITKASLNIPDSDSDSSDSDSKVDIKPTLAIGVNGSHASSSVRPIIGKKVSAAEVYQSGTTSSSSDDSQEED